MGFTLSQPIMVGSIIIHDIPQSLCTEINGILGELLPGEAPPPLGQTEPVLRVVESLLHWHLCIQRQQNIPVFGQAVINWSPTVPAGQSRQIGIVVPYHHPGATKATLDWVLSAANQILTNTDNHQDLDSLFKSLRSFSLTGINILHFLTAASERKIPARQLLPGQYLFGQGCNSRWLDSSVTNFTSAIGMKNAGRKSYTSQILRQFGIPTPAHSAVKSAEEALEAAEKLRFPVVIKPDDQEQGRGVAANLQTAQDLLAAYEIAKAFSKNILVEKHHSGKDYRLTVFRDEVVKILGRDPGGVVGDGSHNIAELLAIAQQTPRFLKYFRQHGKQLFNLDEEALGLLREQGLTENSIPPPRHFVTLRRKSNISAGGIQRLIAIDDAHPDNIQLAIRAARAVNLDLAGVDLLIPDITQSWLATGGVVIEVNARPQIGINLAPEVYGNILTILLGGDGRIPVHLLLCASDSRLPSAQAAHQAMKNRHCNGVALKAGVWLDGQQLCGERHNGFEAARILLCNPGSRAVLCVLSAGDVLSKGLPADQFTSVSLYDAGKASSQEKQRLRAALRLLPPTEKNPNHDDKHFRK